MSIVKPMGRLMPLDADGAIVNDGSLDCLPPRLIPAVEACVEVYRDVLGDALRGVYLRGSAVRGGFVDGIGDLDTWAVSDHPPEVARVVGEPYFEAQERLSERFGIDVELCHSPLERIQMADSVFVRMLLATQGVPVSGRDDRPALGRFWPGADTLGHATHVAKSVSELIDTPPDDVRFASRWICKAVVRAGLEVHAHEHRQYTRDLWPCYCLFAAFQPDAAELMFRLLEVAIEPTDDADRLQSLLAEIRTVLLPLVSRDVLPVTSRG